MIKISSKLGALGTGLAILAVVAMMLGGLGSRLGWWHFGVGFVFLKWGTIGAVLAAAVSLAGVIGGVAQKNRGRMILGGIGLVIGLSAAWVPWSWLQTARNVPPIHDITTDTDNPPAFVAVLPLRRDASNPAEYGGPEVAKQQQAAYPDIVPAWLSMSPDEAFDRALIVVDELGWTMVEADRSEGRIEAVDTTRWFGFKDDIVIRVTPDGKRARVDVRSLSRVGGSDVGANASRIRTFLNRLQP